MVDRKIAASHDTINPLTKRKRKSKSDGPRNRKEKRVECPVCSHSRRESSMVTLSACNCTYCTPCLRMIFLLALMPTDHYENVPDNFPARCCGRVLERVLHEEHLDSQLLRAYKTMEEEKSCSDPVYCGSLDCGKYISEANLKDGFGSCGSCHKKSCTRKECSKPLSEHLGIYKICPGNLETEDLRELAKEKGWKRCPKCYALTERTVGCNDVRCICRTEWCYDCGKAIRGKKHVCTCYAPPPPQRPSNNPPIIFLAEDNDHSIVPAEVRPSIEGPVDSNRAPSLDTATTPPRSSSQSTTLEATITILDNLANPNLVRASTNYNHLDSLEAMLEMYDSNPNPPLASDVSRSNTLASHSLTQSRIIRISPPERVERPDTVPSADDRLSEQFIDIFNPGSGKENEFLAREARVETE